MQWFKNAYDRAEIAEYVLHNGLTQGLAEEYHPGFRRITCAVPAIGALAIMHHYPFRKVYNAEFGSDEPIENPFFRVQLNYRSAAGNLVSTMVEFDDNFAYLKRSSDYTQPLLEQRDPSLIWDEAMAALDETLIMQAQKLGRQIMPEMVAKIPAEQFLELAA